MSSMSLGEAGELWLSGKTDRRLKPRTLEANENYLKRLKEFFGNVMLTDIHAGSFLAYQEFRKETAGVSSINHELNALSQMMKRAGLWEPIKYHYRTLKDTEWKQPQTFTADEEQRIFDFAKDDPNLELSELVFTITRYTSASGSELRLMRLRNLVDINDPHPLVHITGDTTKNHIRPRIIPLVPEAQQAFQRALRRANKLGSWRPEHHLFPLRVNRALWDPTKPASRSWLRKQTVKLRKQTGIQHIQPHTWRHQITTVMLENGTPPETVRSICGWVSEKMIATYCHTRYEAKAEALLSTVAPKKPVQTSENRSSLYIVSRQK